MYHIVVTTGTLQFLDVEREEWVRPPLGQCPTEGIFEYGPTVNMLLKAFLSGVVCTLYTYQFLQKFFTVLYIIYSISPVQEKSHL